MKKIIQIIFIFFISSNISIACDLTFVNFGDKSDKLLEYEVLLPFRDEFNGEKIVIPTTYVCPNNKGMKLLNHQKWFMLAP